MIHVNEKKMYLALSNKSKPSACNIFNRCQEMISKVGSDELGIRVVVKCVSKRGQSLPSASNNFRLEVALLERGLCGDE